MRRSDLSEVSAEVASNEREGDKLANLLCLREAEEAGERPHEQRPLSRKPLAAKRHTPLHLSERVLDNLAP